jgi:hypothetical protein
MWLVVLLLSALAGCRKAPTTPVATGAAEAAHAYYQALLRRDWQEAYAALDPECRARYSPAEFAARAQNYYRELDFEPEAVRVRFCNERESAAIAHVVLTGRAGGRQHRHNDAVALRRGPEGWGIFLADNFGKPARPDTP